MARRGACGIRGGKEAAFAPEPRLSASGSHLVTRGPQDLLPREASRPSSGKFRSPVPFVSLPGLLSISFKWILSRWSFPSGSGAISQRFVRQAFSLPREALLSLAKGFSIRRQGPRIRRKKPFPMAGEGAITQLLRALLPRKPSWEHGERPRRARGWRHFCRHLHRPAAAHGSVACRPRPVPGRGSATTGDPEAVRSGKWR